jgi:type II secretory pathway pseudopilin PulG
MRIKENPGFAMIEAVVAMAVLALISVGVLVGLDSAQRSSGREKARSVAAALTEQDQERMRSFRAVDLDNYDTTRSVTVNNVSYSINSTADWVRDSTGGTQSCSNNLTQADYMRVTTTTTSNLLNSPIPPIKMSSLVAPPVGAFGAGEGTLGIQVTNRDGVGVAGTDVTIAGPTTVTNATNSTGCAIFAYVPVGTYTAAVNQTGWVDHGGNTNATVGATVSDGTVNVKTIDYDRAASVQATFDTETLAGATVSATTTQLSAANAGVPSGPFSPFAGVRSYDPTGGAVASIAGTNLFPFADGYGLYGGGCPGADPTKYITDYYDQFPADFIDTDPGVAATPVVLRLPSINLRVLYNSLAIPVTSPVKIVVTSKSTNCSEKFTFAAPATDAAGWMLTPALPFGDYDVCASANKPLTATMVQKTFTGVQNRYTRGIKPQPGSPPLPSLVSPVIDLNGGTTSGACT